MCKLSEKVKALEIININGNQYLGTTDKEEGVLKLSSAVSVKDSNFKETIKSWIAADKLGELEAIEFEGELQIGRKKFNEQQLLEISSVCTTAEFEMKRAVPNLEIEALNRI